MIVYVITNDALYPDASYNDVFAVTTSLRKAKTLVKNKVKELEFPSVYFDEEIPDEWNNKSGCLAVDKEGWYEHFIITEKELI